MNFEIPEDLTFAKLIDSMNIVLASYGFVLNFFPIYTSMEEKSNKKGM